MLIEFRSFFNKFEKEVKFKFSYPSKNDFFNEYYRPQKHYRIGISEEDFHYTNIDPPCPSDKIDFVKSFILKP